MTGPDDGRDTALARLLLARGVLDVATLRTCLDEVRRRRDVERELSLADVLLAYESTGHELEELVITLLSAGLFEEAGDEVKRVARLHHRRLLQAELRLAQRDPTVLSELEELALTEEHFVEPFVALAHARHRAGDPRWADALNEASRPGLRPFGIEWRSLEQAREVIVGQGWWPGR